MNQRTQRVLLVEDDADVRELLRIVLAQTGYTVNAVEDGQCAKAALQTACHDLLITDYHLPDIQGNLLISYARSVYPCLATLLISAEPGVAHIAALCHAHAWFVKGQPLAGFLAAVTAALDRAG
ncbi:MAG TPA: response regulator [Armatimonadota bacterium]|nr:response regulator [Armatimonadota bacterium]